MSLPQAGDYTSSLSVLLLRSRRIRAITSQNNGFPRNYSP